MKEPMTIDILIFGAHPDDAEIGMGATIKKHTDAGRTVGICDLTFAEMSSNGTVETRIKEANEAAGLLGLTYRSNLGLPDRGLQMCREHIEQITLEIRMRKPRIVFAPYWQDRHPDHVMCSQLVQEAVFNAKLRKYLPETEAHQVEQLWFYFINDVYEPNAIIDVTSVYEHKIAALRAYATQFDPAGSGNNYVNTPLNQSYVERVEARDRMTGQNRMVGYAEGFVSKQPVVMHLF